MVHTRTFDTVQLPVCTVVTVSSVTNSEEDTRRTTPGPFHIIILYASHCSPSLRFNGQSVTNLAITKNMPDTTVEM